MLSLQEHVEIESARWRATRGDVSLDTKSIASSAATSTVDSVFSSQLHSKYKTHTLSRRSSTSSFATEIEPEPAHQQPFVVPRDFNGAPITVYASLEAAVAQSTQLYYQSQSQVQANGQGAGGEDAGRAEEEQPRRLVTPGKLYENEEEDDEIIYD